MSDSKQPSGIWNLLRREPLVHFLGIAALLFIANAVFSGDDRELVVVDWPTQEFLVQQQEEMLLRPLSEQEKRRIVDTFIEEEIFVREARKRGFESSSRIRALLIQNMRFFLTSDLPTVTDDELRRFFDENPDRFATTPTTSYDHVLFADPKTVPADTLQQLNAGAEFTQMGDTQEMVGHRLVQINERTIAATFGPEQAPRVLAIIDDDWHGPYESQQGAHFLRVSERHPVRHPIFEDIDNWVQQEWTLMKSRERIEAELERLQKDYRIEVQGPGM